MRKLTSEEVLSALKDMQRASGMDATDVFAYIKELESKASRLEEELRKLRLSASRKPASGSPMNSRLMDALRE